MEINNDLILQWEPKINKMLSNIYIQGYDKDDLAQELRMIVLKAAKLYKPNRNAIFHTYLHTAMVNRLKTLWLQASKKIQSYSLDFETSEVKTFKGGRKKTNRKKNIKKRTRKKRNIKKN